MAVGTKPCVCLSLLGLSLSFLAVCQKGRTVPKPSSSVMSSLKLSPACNRTSNLQAGNYSAQMLPAYMEPDAVTATPAKTVRAAPRIEVPYRHYLSQVNGACSVIDSPHVLGVNEYVKTPPWAYGGMAGNGGGGIDPRWACGYNGRGGQVSRFLVHRSALHCCHVQNTVESKRRNVYKGYSNSQNQPNAFVDAR